MPNIDRILHAISNLPNQAYSPREDSFLILDALSNYTLTNVEVLDVGTGSGLLGLFCAQEGAFVTVTDIHDSILEHVLLASSKLGLRVKATKSDLFSNVVERFDIVLFNPPYLPSKEIEDTTTDAGKDGRGLIDRFLEGLIHHLKPEGFGLLLVSTLNDPESIIERHPTYSITVLSRSRLFFEELQVLLCRPRRDPASQCLDG